MDGLYLKKLKDVDKTSAVLYTPPFEKISTPEDNSNKMEQLSGVMIIIIIGGGVLTFVMLFIFAKRQIMRFTLRSRRGPHVPVGNDAKKVNLTLKFVSLVIIVCSLDFKERNRTPIGLYTENCTRAQIIME